MHNSATMGDYDLYESRGEQNVRNAVRSAASIVIHIIRIARDTIRSQSYCLTL